RRARVRAARRDGRGARRSPRRRRHLGRHGSPPGGRAWALARRRERSAARARPPAPPRVRSRAIRRRGASHAAPGACAPAGAGGVSAVERAVLVGANGATQVAVGEPVHPGIGWRAAFALGSGLALAAAFPSLDWEPLAWVGLVPLFTAIRGQTPGR